jgi:hypothetical protein
MRQANRHISGKLRQSPLNEGNLTPQTFIESRNGMVKSTDAPLIELAN